MKTPTALSVTSGNRLLYDFKCRGCQGRTFAQRETSKIPRLPFTSRGFPLPRLLLNFYALGKLNPRFEALAAGVKKSNFLSRHFNPARFSPVKHTYLSLDTYVTETVHWRGPDSSSGGNQITLHLTEFQ